MTALDWLKVFKNVTRKNKKRLYKVQIIMNLIKNILGKEHITSLQDQTNKFITN